MSKKVRLSATLNRPIINSATVKLENNSKNEIDSVVRDGPKLGGIDLGINPIISSVLSNTGSTSDSFRIRVGSAKLTNRPRVLSVQVTTSPSRASVGSISLDTQAFFGAGTVTEFNTPATLAQEFAEIKGSANAILTNAINLASSKLFSNLQNGVLTGQPQVANFINTSFPLVKSVEVLAAIFRYERSALSNITAITPRISLQILRGLLNSTTVTSILKKDIRNTERSTLDIISKPFFGSVLASKNSVSSTFVKDTRLNAKNIIELNEVISKIVLLRPFTSNISAESKFSSNSKLTKLAKANTKDSVFIGPNAKENVSIRTVLRLFAPFTVRSFGQVKSLPDVKPRLRKVSNTEVVSKLREKRFVAIKTNIVGTTIKLQKDVSKSLEIFTTAESKVEKRPRLRKLNSATVSSRLFPGIHAGANFTLSRIYSLPTKKTFKRVNLNLEILQDKFVKEFRANKVNNTSVVENPFIGHFFSLNSKTKSLVSKQPNLGKISNTNIEAIITKQPNLNKLSKQDLTSRFFTGRLYKSRLKAFSLVTKQPNLNKISSSNVETVITKQPNLNKISNQNLTSRFFRGRLNSSRSKVFSLVTKQPNLNKISSSKLESVITKQPNLNKISNQDLRSILYAGRYETNFTNLKQSITKQPNLNKVGTVGIEEAISKYFKASKASRTILDAIAFIGPYELNTSNVKSAIKDKFFKKNTKVAKLALYPEVSEGNKASLTIHPTFSSTPTIQGPTLLEIKTKELDINGTPGSDGSFEISNGGPGRMTNTSAHPLTYISSINATNLFPGPSRALIYTVEEGGAGISAGQGHSLWDQLAIGSSPFHAFYNYRYGSTGVTIINGRPHLKSTFTVPGYSSLKGLGNTADGFTRLILPRGGSSPSFVTLNITNGFTLSNPTSTGSFQQSITYQDGQAPSYRPFDIGLTYYRDTGFVYPNSNGVVKLHDMWPDSGGQDIFGTANIIGYNDWNLNGYNNGNDLTGVGSLIVEHFNYDPFSGYDIRFTHISEDPIYIVNSVYPSFVPVFYNETTYNATKTFNLAGSTIQEIDTVTVPESVFLDATSLGGDLYSKLIIASIGNETKTLGEVNGNLTRFPILPSGTEVSYFTSELGTLNALSANTTSEDLGTNIQIKGVHEAAVNPTDSRIQANIGNSSVNNALKTFDLQEDESYLERDVLSIPDYTITPASRYTLTRPDGTTEELPYGTTSLNIFNSFQQTSNASVNTELSLGNRKYTFNYTNSVINTDPRILQGSQFWTDGFRIGLDQAIAKKASIGRISTAQFKETMFRGTFLKSSFSTVEGFKLATILKSFTDNPERANMASIPSVRGIPRKISKASVTESITKSPFLTSSPMAKSIIAKFLEQSHSTKFERVGIDGLDRLFFSQFNRPTSSIGLSQHVIPAKARFFTSVPSTRSLLKFFLERDAIKIQLEVDEIINKFSTTTRKNNISLGQHIIPAYAVLPRSRVGIDTSHFFYYKLKDIPASLGTAKSFVSLKGISTNFNNVNTSDTLLKGRFTKNFTTTRDEVSKFSRLPKKSRLNLEDIRLIKTNKNLDSKPEVVSSLIRGFLIPDETKLVGQLDEATRIAFKNSLSRVDVAELLTAQYRGIRKSFASTLSETFVNGGTFFKLVLQFASEKRVVTLRKGDRDNLVNPLSLISNLPMKIIDKDLAQTADSGFLFAQNYSTGYFSQGYVGKEEIF